MERYYVGLDLHSTNTYVGILSEGDRRIFKGRFSNDLEEIIEVLKPFKESIAGVVVESTFNWYWLVDGLKEAGYQVHLANPVAIKQYKGLKYTDDKHDAFFLAKLLQLNILPEGYIFPKEERHIRDLLRKRLMLVRQKTMHVLSFKSLVNRNLGVSIRSDKILTLKEDEMDEWFANEHLRNSAKANLSAMKYLAGKIDELEKFILKTEKLRPEYKCLITVPGIGKILSLTIMLETGNISRFKGVGNFASYCRCVPSQRISNDKVKGKNNRKNGNKYLSWAFVEAANFAKRYCPYGKVFYLKKVRQTNQVIAVKSLAHKLARACYWILKDQVPYDGSKMFAKSHKGNKGCGSEPKGGLTEKVVAPIGQSAATTL